MISRSIYISGKNDALDFFTKEMNISKENTLWNGNHESDYSFYRRKENAAFVSLLKGYFSHAFDIDIFDRNWIDIDKKFIELSSAGLTIAVPDEKSSDPFSYIVYENGIKRSAWVLENEINEELILKEKKSDNHGEVD